uniref:Small GTP-binding protein domain containing protein n=1 Tax=Babesia bovis TaxID=5865 RepID=S6BIY6_BABBO|nr:small GTP-binding protein domain containing protein [Babesia bovis]
MYPITGRMPQGNLFRSAYVTYILVMTTQASTVTWDSPMQPPDASVVRVSLVGLPNAGKSSLMNMLLNTPIAAVSPKVNTTREDIKGILCSDSCQMVFTDCPGILESHRRRKFCAPLVDTAWRAYRESDVCLFIIDAVKRPRAELFRVIRNLAGATPLFTRYR